MGAADFGKGQVEGVVGRLTASLTDITDVFEHAVGPISKFVEALSPGSMQLFNLAMKDLNATIGTAFLPMIHTLTEGVTKAANLLVPAMQALAPAVQSLANAFMSYVTPAVMVTSHALKDMAPLLEAVGDVLKTLGDALAIVTVITLSVKDALGDFFKGLLGGGGGNGLKDMMNKLRDAVYSVMTVMLVAAATIANSFGAGGFIDGLKKNLLELTNKGSEGGVGGALSGAGLKGFEQISKDLALAAAAAVAGGDGGEDKKLEEFARDAVAQLTEVQKNGTTVQALMKDIWKEAERFFAAQMQKAVDAIIAKMKPW